MMYEILVQQRLNEQIIIERNYQDQRVRRFDFRVPREPCTFERVVVPPPKLLHRGRFVGQTKRVPVGMMPYIIVPGCTTPPTVNYGEHLAQKRGLQVPHVNRFEPYYASALPQQQRLVR